METNKLSIIIPVFNEEEVVNEANKIYYVNEVFPSIYLATELSRNKL